MTSETASLILSGVVSGLATVLLWRAVKRTRLGAAAFVAAVLVSAGLSARFDRLEWDPMMAAGLAVTVLACAGAVSVGADPAVHWRWVAAGGLVSAAGVWAGVPETGPALLVGSSLLGLAIMTALTGARWAPSAGVGLVTTLGWAALSGAAGRPWAALGGVLCTGVAPWLALHRLVAPRRRIRAPRPWLLVAHMVLVLLAARWIGADADANWVRVSVVAVAGGVVASVQRRQA